MAKSSNRKPPATVGGGRVAVTAAPKSERELILVAATAVSLRASARGVASAAGANVDALSATLEAAGASLQPLFGEPEDRIRAAVASLSATSGLDELPDLSVYYRVNAPDEKLDALAAKLRTLESVDAAYVKPAAQPASLMDAVVPRMEEAPPATPDFTARQGYLDAAPGGIDARYAWTKPGGSGAGVAIIDIEGEWRFSHEDLLQNQGGMVGGAAANDLLWRNHGTAVIGEFGGDRNPSGITGICPDANVRGISIFGGLGSAAAIRMAADMLSPGGIILIELHRPGPRFNFENRGDQRGFIAMEWWPDDFDAIRYATARGVLVVEAAGNGAENFDDPLYDAPANGFPASWSNPFRRGARDSGAILVGAGAPPPGTHGANWGNDRSRLDFSNYGAAIDTQGWGREVTTGGYGDLQGGSSEDLWYTDRFSGTSSASPIVVGALGCVQGLLRARGTPLLTPATARALLRSTGSAQQDGPSGPATQRIGTRPDLRQMIDRLAPVPPTRVPLYRYWNQRDTDHFYTTDWAELGNGRHGWIFEKIQCYVFPSQVAGSVPLFRYWNPSIADHFYTTDFSELGNGRHGWTFEKVQCYVSPGQVAGSIPLYRYWNQTDGDHFYTTNWAELGNGRYGWRYEKIQCYVFSNATAGSPSGGAVDDGSMDHGPVPSSFVTSFGGESGPSADDGVPPESFRSSTTPDQPPPSFATPSNEAGTRPASFTTSHPGDVAATRDGTGGVQITIRVDR